MIRIYAFIIGGVLFATLLVTAYHTIKQMGRVEERIEQAETVRRKLNNATIADDVNSRCLADPSCRLSNDGFRRD